MKVVGVSACPAGLAHTPMAAKALEKAGKKIGFDVKMEQQGSMGQVNKITNEEAQAADFVLLQISILKAWIVLKVSLLFVLILQLALKRLKQF